MRDAINAVVDAKAEADKQAAVRERGALLVDLLLQGDVPGIRQLIQTNEHTEVYNVSDLREECPYSRPIEIAVHRCLPEAVLLLLDAGADPDVTHAQVRS